MIKIPYSLLNGVSRQRYTLLRLFADHPASALSRQDIMARMKSEPYTTLLDPDKDLDDAGSFSNLSKPTNAPTILRDRLDELVKAGFISCKRQGREVYYNLTRKIGSDLDETWDPSENDAELIQAMGSSLAKYPELPFGDLIDSLSVKARRVNGSRKSETYSIVDFETPFIAEKDRSKIASLYYAINDRCIIPEIKYLGHFPAKGRPKEHSCTQLLSLVCRVKSPGKSTQPPSGANQVP